MDGVEFGEGDHSSEVSRWDILHPLAPAIWVGDRQIAVGGTVAHEEAKRRLRTWLPPVVES
jgi:hypothetical protein